ncbi:type II toxin-antitoxin system Phd/YefM family antitoxin [Quadrisphaera sp. DSM 44207]|uniref:type II toxin-antitoxin system Phd/YefM family antitoxin n=1 Tax=Quadrisphaera sp. DSM 44207 TaxID=1881057 RepID=UPI00088AAD01|nr:type II toxin-antitoxin system Phd/YefM family antitoxin [Quadrisphaera sp. DSM 44207]SDQ35272.1 prevent-host-death family protein [Quadrisphaera sp. DSM 44207]
MTTLPLAEVRAQLSSLVDEAQATHERYDITRNGRRAAVLLSAEDFDALEETLAVLADQDLLRAHLTGLAEVAAGDVVDADVVQVVRDRKPSSGVDDVRDQ